MITAHTVFVVGAGASLEVGLPTGEGLKTKICGLLKQEFGGGYVNRRFANAGLRLCEQEQNQFTRLQTLTENIRDGLPGIGSIDTFLNIHNSEPLLVSAGKIAIAIAIIDAERDSEIASHFNLPTEYLDTPGGPNDDPNRPRYENSWFVHLGRLLTQNITRETVDQVFENISFITYNYDRVIETWAFEWVKRTFALDHNRAAEIAARLEVLHVYGQVGQLPWVGGDVAFGAAVQSDPLVISRGIRTFTETVDSEAGERIKDRMSDARTVVFLGFGWLPQNLELLKARSGNKVERVFYTTKGIEEPDRETVELDLRRMFSKRVQHDRGVLSDHFRAFEEQGGCADLFRRHWRQLTTLP